MKAIGFGHHHIRFLSRNNRTHLHKYMHYMHEEYKKQFSPLIYKHI